ncbi:hypothetical protein ALC62_11734 [Cyphomyrmex costatus]|uniref:Uncharacterized protein n=1 Tax=Cyphomyrmex costatus TaxID=456900 RepID=A0A195C9E3_9HYME|nr:hypothetical protein ALC62_11734 [Cyphomyrmex costatus]
MQVTPLPHDRDTISYVAIKAKGSEERNARFRELRGRALENMSTYHPLTYSAWFNDCGL